MPSTLLSWQGWNIGHISFCKQQPGPDIRSINRDYFFLCPAAELEFVWASKHNCALLCWGGQTCSHSNRSQKSASSFLSLERDCRLALCAGHKERQTSKHLFRKIWRSFPLLYVWCFRRPWRVFAKRNRNTKRCFEEETFEHSSHYSMEGVATSTWHTRKRPLTMYRYVNLLTRPLDSESFSPRQRTPKAIPYIPV